MQWEVKFEKKAKKDLDKIPKTYQKKILAALAMIGEDPYAGKKLEGEMKGLFSCRVWPYRIIYKIYGSLLLVVIIRVGHRQGVYK